MRGSFHRPSDQASCFPCCPFHLLFMRLSVEIKSHQRVRVHNSIANASKGVLFLPPSDVYVRSFLYPFYTLIKLLHKSSVWSSLPELKSPKGSFPTSQLLPVSTPRPEPIPVLWTPAMLSLSPEYRISVLPISPPLCAPPHPTTARFLSGSEARAPHYSNLSSFAYEGVLCWAVYLGQAIFGAPQRPGC